MPVTIIAGADDLVVDVEAHSKRLHHDVPQSEMTLVPHTGHMVHYAAPQEIVAAVAKQSLNVLTSPETEQASKSSLELAA